MNESEFREWVGTCSMNPPGVYQKSRFIIPRKVTYTEQDRWLWRSTSWTLRQPV